MGGIGIGNEWYSGSYGRKLSTILEVEMNLGQEFLLGKSWRRKGKKPAL